MFNFAAPEGSAPIAATIYTLLQLLSFAIFVRAILSWFQMDRSNPILQALDAVVEPIVDPIRRVMPRIGFIDLSPLVAIILLEVIAVMFVENVNV